MAACRPNGRYQCYLQQVYHIHVYFDVMGLIDQGSILIWAEDQREILFYQETEDLPILYQAIDLWLKSGYHSSLSLADFLTKTLEEI